MAEFCKRCFVETWHPTEEEIAKIVMSNDLDYCEGCGICDHVVEYIDMSEKVKE